MHNIIKPKTSFDSFSYDTLPLSGKGKFSFSTLRRSSSTTNLRNLRQEFRQEDVNTPQILQRSLSSIFRKIPKTSEKKDCDSIIDDDISSITSSDSSVDETDTKPNNNKKFISMFGGAFNSSKRKKYNFNEIVVSSEVIVTTSDLIDERDAAANLCPESPKLAIYETHLRTPTHNYSYYSPTSPMSPISPISPNLTPLSEEFSLPPPHISRNVSINSINGRDLPTIPDENDDSFIPLSFNLNDDVQSEELVVASSSNQSEIIECSASTSSITSSIEPTTEVTEIWPFARFPQRSAFHNLSDLPPTAPFNPLPPRSIPIRPPSLIVEKRSINNYGICEKCKKPRTGILWCQSCYESIFQKDFSNWTSGCNKIDQFIKTNQLYSSNINELLEWIPFEKFKDLQLIGEGGYSTVYLAKWTDGRILDLNEDGEWERTGENDVVLKILHDSKDLPQDYLNEFNLYHQHTSTLNSVIRCYGISRDPFAKNTIMVMEYAKDKDLKDYLKNNFRDFTWNKRISILYDITQSLKSIHKAGLVHKNLHSGNVLIHDDYAFIGDLGLCTPKIFNDDSFESLYGVLPYVAPEVLRGNQFTMASDIYSLGMIMYELAISSPPYHNYSSDEHLLHDICNGIKPKVTVDDLPKCFIELMIRCWSQSPEDRPKADYIAQIVENWKNNFSNVKEEFNIAEEFRLLQTYENTNIREKLLGNYKSKALPRFCEISSNE